MQTLVLRASELLFCLISRLLFEGRDGAGQEDCVPQRACQVSAFCLFNSGQLRDGYCIEANAL